MFASVADERDNKDVAVGLECLERHFRRQIRARARSAGEGHRRAAAVVQNAGDEVVELRELARVDSRDGRLEQLVVGVAEHRATGRIACDEPVLERVEQERRLLRGGEEVVEGQACLIPSTWSSTLSG